MSTATPAFPVIREAVASFPDRGHFRNAVAAVVGAGLGGAALKELFDDYTAAPHADEFAAALADGAALLWVRCADPDLELRALRILEEAGGRRVHIHGRPAAEAAA